MVLGMRETKMDFCCTLAPKSQSVTVNWLTCVAFHWHVTQQPHKLPLIVLDIWVWKHCAALSCVCRSIYILRCVALSPPCRLLENSAILDQYERASLTCERAERRFTPAWRWWRDTELRKVINVSCEWWGTQWTRWEQLSRSILKASQLCNSVFLCHADLKISIEWKWMLIHYLVRTCHQSNPKVTAAMWSKVFRLIVKIVICFF